MLNLVQHEKNWVKVHTRIISTVLWEKIQNCTIITVKTTVVIFPPLHQGSHSCFISGVWSRFYRRRDYSVDAAAAASVEAAAAASSATCVCACVILKKKKKNSMYVCIYVCMWTREHNTHTHTHTHTHASHVSKCTTSQTRSL